MSEAKPSLAACLSFPAQNKTMLTVKLNCVTFARHTNRKSFTHTWTHCPWRQCYQATHLYMSPEYIEKNQSGGMQILLHLRHCLSPWVILFCYRLPVWGWAKHQILPHLYNKKPIHPSPFALLSQGYWHYKLRGPESDSFWVCLQNWTDRAPDSAATLAIQIVGHQYINIG